MIVSDVPGTTHDPVNVTVEYQGSEITLIDTAGIKKQMLRGKGLERSTLLWSLKAIERSHVVIHMVDPVVGINLHDQMISRHIIEHMKSGKFFLKKLLKKK